MVNSGTFDTNTIGQGDRNAKVNCTHPDADVSSESIVTHCKIGAPAWTSTADGDVATSAHSNDESTPDGDTSHTNLVAEAASTGDADDSITEEDKGTLCCSVPLEKVQGVLRPFQPPKCEETKSTRKLLDSKRKDMVRMTLLCLYCERSFASANLRQKHVERIHSIKKNRRLSSRKQNQLTVTPCIYCDKLDTSENTLKDLFQHLINEHSNKYFGCLPCEERFITTSLLSDHNASQHPTLPETSEKTPVKLTPAEDSSTPEKEITVKLTRSKTKPKAESTDNPERAKKVIRSKNAKLKELRSKKLTVKSSRIALNRRESKRLQAISDAQKKKRQKPIERGKQTSVNNKTEPVPEKSSCINPYPQFDHFYRVKKITDHSIDNLKISSLTFDDVFDKTFFNRIKCNIEENLLHHIDGKLFKNEESESRISNFEKVSTTKQEVQNAALENYGCELSLNAVTPVASLSLNSQFGEDFESQIEYGSKPSKKKTQTKKDEVHYKYFTRRKFQASILEQTENRDLSKLDMWTQLVIKKRQQKIIDDKKTPKEIQEYATCDEYKNKVRREELNSILDRRGPFEDLREESSKKAALDKLNSDSEDSISHESFTEVREVLNEILNRVFAMTEEVEERIEEQTTTRCQTPIDSKQDLREIPSFLNLRRSSSFPNDGEIDQSDKITLICSSQETESFELPTNQTRGKNELIELSGEWARCRMYICAACGAKVPNMRYLLDHKTNYHQSVWVQHYEFVGNQSELYRHLSIPALGKVGYIEDNVPCKTWRRSEARTCTKCAKQCNSLGELHRHILECGGDWTWMLARKKCKYRYGAKSRRKRRGLVIRVRHHKRKTDSTEKKKYKYDGPRQRPSDAETIQRMLANLPAKRSTRKLISLYDGVRRRRKNQELENVKQKKVKCGKVIYSKSSNIKETTEKTINTAIPHKPQKTSQSSNIRSLRSLNRVLSSRILDTNTKLSVKRKLKVLNERRRTRQSAIAENSKQKKANNAGDTSQPSSSPQPRKKSEKTEANSPDTAPKRTSPRSTKIVRKLTVKKLLTGNINIKSFFPVKKRKDKKETKEDATLEKNVDIQTRSKKKIGDPEGAEETVISDSKTKKSDKLSNLVRSLSINKKKNSKKTSQEEIAQKNPELEPSKNTSSKEDLELNRRKRKLKQSFRNVINRVKRLKIDNAPETVQTTDKNKPPSTKSPFLDEAKQEKDPVKIVIPSTIEAKENIADISETAHTVITFNEANEDSPVPENIFKLDCNNEKHLQAKGEPNFDTQSVVEQTQLIAKITMTDVKNLLTIEDKEKLQPISIETSEKPKIVPMISPNMKGKIRKPARGLNDCIAMLTNKLQQQSSESVSKPNHLEVLPSVTTPKIVTDPSPQKAECILKIPTFKTHNEQFEEVALDLSIKSKSKDTDLQPPLGNKNLLSKQTPWKFSRLTSVERIIENVVNNRLQEPQKLKLPPSHLFSSIDQTIQNVIDGHLKQQNIKPLQSRSSVDDIIDYVINFGSSVDNLHKTLGMLLPVKPKERGRKIGSVRKMKKNETKLEIGTNVEKLEIKENDGMAVDRLGNTLALEKASLVQLEPALNKFSIAKEKVMKVAKKIGQIRRSRSKRKPDPGQLLIENNIDDVLDTQEIVNTLQVPIESKDTEKHISDEDEPHIMENKTVSDEIWLPSLHKTVDTTSTEELNKTVEKKEKIQHNNKQNLRNFRKQSKTTKTTVPKKLNSLDVITTTSFEDEERTHASNPDNNHVVEPNQSSIGATEGTKSIDDSETPGEKVSTVTSPTSRRLKTVMRKSNKIKNKVSKKIEIFEEKEKDSSENTNQVLLPTEIPVMDSQSKYPQTESRKIDQTSDETISTHVKSLNASFKTKKKKKATRKLRFTKKKSKKLNVWSADTESDRLEENERIDVNIINETEEIGDRLVTATTEVDKDIKSSAVMPDDDDIEAQIEITVIGKPTIDSDNTSDQKLDVPNELVKRKQTIRVNKKGKRIGQSKKVKNKSEAVNPVLQHSLLLLDNIQKENVFDDPVRFETPSNTDADQTQSIPETTEVQNIILTESELCKTFKKPSLLKTKKKTRKAKRLTQSRRRTKPAPILDEVFIPSESHANILENKDSTVDLPISESSNDNEYLLEPTPVGETSQNEVIVPENIHTVSLVSLSSVQNAPSPEFTLKDSVSLENKEEHCVNEEDKSDDLNEMENAEIIKTVEKISQNKGIQKSKKLAKRSKSIKVNNTKLHSEIPVDNNNVRNSPTKLIQKTEESAVDKPKTLKSDIKTPTKRSTSPKKSKPNNSVENLNTEMEHTNITQLLSSNRNESEKTPCLDESENVVRLTRSKSPKKSAPELSSTKTHENGDVLSDVLISDTLNFEIKTPIKRSRSLKNQSANENASKDAEQSGKIDAELSGKIDEIREMVNTEKIKNVSSEINEINAGKPISVNNPDQSLNMELEGVLSAKMYETEDVILPLFSKDASAEIEVKESDKTSKYVSNSSVCQENLNETVGDEISSFKMNITSDVLPPEHLKDINLVSHLKKSHKKSKSLKQSSVFLEKITTAIEDNIDSNKLEDNYLPKQPRDDNLELEAKQLDVLKLIDKSSVLLDNLNTAIDTTEPSSNKVDESIDVLPLKDITKSKVKKSTRRSRSLRNLSVSLGNVKETSKCIRNSSVSLESLNTLAQEDIFEENRVATKDLLLPQELEHSNIKVDTKNQVKLSKSIKQFSVSLESLNTAIDKEISLDKINKNEDCLLSQYDDDSNVESKVKKRVKRLNYLKQSKSSLKSLSIPVENEIFSNKKNETEDFIHSKRREDIILELNLKKPSTRSKSQKKATVSVSNVRTSVEEEIVLDKLEESEVVSPKRSVESKVKKLKALKKSVFVNNLNIEPVSLNEMDKVEDLLSPVQLNFKKINKPSKRSKSLMKLVPLEISEVPTDSNNEIDNLPPSELTEGGNIEIKITRPSRKSKSFKKSYLENVTTAVEEESLLDKLNETPDLLLAEKPDIDPDYKVDKLSSSVDNANPFIFDENISSNEGDVNKDVLLLKLSEDVTDIKTKKSTRRPKSPKKSLVPLHTLNAAIEHETPLFETSKTEDLLVTEPSERVSLQLKLKKPTKKSKSKSLKRPSVLLDTIKLSFDGEDILSNTVDEYEKCLPLENSNVELKKNKSTKRSKSPKKSLTSLEILNTTLHTICSTEMDEIENVLLQEKAEDFNLEFNAKKQTKRSKCLKRSVSLENVNTNSLSNMEEDTSLKLDGNEPLLLLDKTSTKKSKKPLKRLINQTEESPSIIANSTETSFSSPICETKGVLQSQDVTLEPPVRTMRSRSPKKSKNSKSLENVTVTATDINIDKSTENVGKIRNTLTPEESYLDLKLNISNNVTDMSVSRDILSFENISEHHTNLLLDQPEDSLEIKSKTLKKKSKNQKEPNSVENYNIDDSGFEDQRVTPKRRSRAVKESFAKKSDTETRLGEVDTFPDQTKPRKRLGRSNNNINKIESEPVQNNLRGNQNSKLNDTLFGLNSDDLHIRRTRSATNILMSSNESLSKLNDSLDAEVCNILSQSEFNIPDFKLTRSKRRSSSLRNIFDSPSITESSEAESVMQQSVSPDQKSRKTSRKSKNSRFFASEESIDKLDAKEADNSKSELISDLDGDFVRPLIRSKSFKSISEKINKTNDMTPSPLNEGSYTSLNETDGSFNNDLESVHSPEAATSPESSDVKLLEEKIRNAIRQSLIMSMNTSDSSNEGDKNDSVSNSVAKLDTDQDVHSTEYDQVTNTSELTNNISDLNEQLSVQDIETPKRAKRSSNKIAVTNNILPEVDTGASTRSLRKKSSINYAELEETKEITEESELTDNKESKRVDDFNIDAESKGAPALEIKSSDISETQNDCIEVVNDLVQREELTDDKVTEEVDFKNQEIVNESQPYILKENLSKNTLLNTNNGASKKRTKLRAKKGKKRAMRNTKSAITTNAEDMMEYKEPQLVNVPITSENITKVSDDNTFLATVSPNTDIVEKEPPIKIIINKQKARRKSKNIKKVGEKVHNDLFEDFALVIKKKRIITFSPPDTFSKEDTYPMEVHHVPKILDVSEKEDLNDSVQEMDMELDEIPINTNIIETPKLDLPLPNSYDIADDPSELEHNRCEAIEKVFGSNKTSSRKKKGKNNKRTGNKLLTTVPVLEENIKERVQMPFKNVPIDFEEISASECKLPLLKLNAPLNNIDMFCRKDNIFPDIFNGNTSEISEKYLDADMSVNTMLNLDESIKNTFSKHEYEEPCSSETNSLVNESLQSFVEPVIIHRYKRSKKKGLKCKSKNHFLLNKNVEENITKIAHDKTTSLHPDLLSNSDVEKLSIENIDVISPTVLNNVDDSFLSPFKEKNEETEREMNKSVSEYLETEVEKTSEEVEKGSIESASEEFTNDIIDELDTNFIKPQTKLSKRGKKKGSRKKSRSKTLSVGKVEDNVALNMFTEIDAPLKDTKLNNGDLKLENRIVEPEDDLPISFKHSIPCTKIDDISKEDIDKIYAFSETEDFELEKPIELPRRIPRKNENIEKITETEQNEILSIKGVIKKKPKIIVKETVENNLEKENDLSFSGVFKEDGIADTLKLTKIKSQLAKDIPTLEPENEIKDSFSGVFKEDGIADTLKVTKRKSQSTKEIPTFEPENEIKDNFSGVFKEDGIADTLKLTKRKSQSTKEIPTFEPENEIKDNFSGVFKEDGIADTLKLTKRKSQSTKEIPTLEPENEIKDHNVIESEISGGRKSMRSAKVKALEHIHDEALAELTDVEVSCDKKSIKDTKTVDVVNKKVKHKKKTEKTLPEFDFPREVLTNETPLLEDFVAELDGFEELDNSIERELRAEMTIEDEQADFKMEKCTEEQDIGNLLVEEPIDNILTADESQELRRSRRGSRKVASYNENDLIDPLIDAIESKRKTRKKDDKNIGDTKQKKGREPERKLNSEELFDLLKASTNDNMYIPKQQNSFLNSLEDSSRDVTDDNFDNMFENMLEKSAFLTQEKFIPRHKEDIEKIYEFTESPENMDCLTEDESRTKLTKKYRKTPEDIEPITVTQDSNSESKSKSDKFESNFCEICNKSFVKLENLIKHRRTLTHIQKLSEIEAKEAEKSKIINRHEDENSRESVIEPPSLIEPTEEFAKTDLQISELLGNKEHDMQSPFTTSSSLKLADIISDVLNKPVLPSIDEEPNTFSDIILQHSDTKRYKSLGERKSFDSDTLLTSETHLTEPFESKTKILEKQISLLENIIENQTAGNYIDDISLSSEKSDTPSEPSITKPTSDNSFLKPTQYEEISEDSVNLRSYDDQKLRKTLNRDEELFLECCSLLKSSSEVSSSYSNKKMQEKVVGALGLKQVDESDWTKKNDLMEDRDLDDIDEYSNNSRIPTPLGNSYDDSASNSNTISSSWDMDLSTEKTGEDVNDARFSFQNMSEKQKENGNSLKFEGILSRERHNLVQIDLDNTFYRKSSTDDFSDGSINDNKKIMTKGARKVFEGLKVSIPTEELNLKEVLNYSPKQKKIDLATDHGREEEKLLISPTQKSRNSRKSKPVKKAQVGSNLLFKVTKKKLPSPTIPNQELQKDVYDFEETQDNTDVFIKPDFKAFRNMKTGENEIETESRDYREPPRTEPEPNVSISSTKKSKAQENITKKKCMIMGRIFKNAAKSKIEDIDEEIRTIPAIDNEELVENYVANCNKIVRSEPKPSSEKEFNVMSNEQFEEPEFENDQKQSVKSKLEGKKQDHKKKIKHKGKKRVRTNSESTDDEFSLNKNTKRRTNKKNAKEEDNVINLEQELKECIGVASRKSQRKCTSGKQNVLVEYWSSDDSQFEALLEKQIIEIRPKEKPIEKHEQEILEPPSEIVFEAPPVVENTRKPLESKRMKKKTSGKKKPKSQEMTVDGVTVNRRKRAAVNPLYHWSSSSEDETSDLIEVKPLRDEIEDDEDRPVQHGWIVGDSPKKLVTMLAQAKGKKADIDSVKEQGKKRTNTAS